MTKTILIGVLLIYISACSKPAENKNLPLSLQELITENSACICDPYLNQFSWRNQTVYLLGFTGPGCDWMPSYYDIEGEVIAMEPGYTMDDFMLEAKLIKTVWRCEQ